MKKPAKGTSAIPFEFLQRMAQLLGNEYFDFFSCLHRSPRTGLRVNTLKISTSEFRALSPFQLSQVPWCPSGFIVENTGDEFQQVQPSKHSYHAAGLYYLQEPSAMAAAEALAPMPGEKVLDLAAAPGGKSTQLAVLMNNTGVLVANEIHPKRVWDLAENLERCGVTNTIVTNETPQNLADHFGEYFDRVLLDAPCSGEGMFRKGNVARQEWRPELVQGCAIRQSAILEQAARMLRPGGNLVYSTCTFSPEENEAVVANFLAHHPEFDLEVITPIPGFSPGRPDWIGLPSNHLILRTIRIWPHLANAEGHFIASLLKHEASSQYRGQVYRQRSASLNKNHVSKTGNSVHELVDDFCRANLTISFDSSHLAIVGSHIYLESESAPALTGLHVIHPGWWLGTIRKTRFIPAHALAMGLKSDQAAQILRLRAGDPRLLSYFAGESFPDPGNDAWVLMTVDGYPIGWGKRVQNMLKNYYPHGLRRTV